MLTFPNINPVALELGPLKIYWYGLAYMVGILLAWKIAAALIKNYPNNVEEKQLDDSIFWLIVGIVVGGRLGHVIFYTPHLFWTNPLEILKTWQGGMSFHGGLVGVIIALTLYVRREQIKFLSILDIIACVTPLGLFFGRIANFINGELWGRPTTVKWGMIFPYADGLPRHPSQLYEAATEGLLLFLLLVIVWAKTDLRHQPGRIAGLFGIGYALARSFCELYREPEIFVLGSLTIGQALSIPLIGIGWFLVRRPVTPTNEPKNL
ncbi:prolipoprotein diacylglyceryl transferase [Candidatus Odyssella acanthamoebae]|uniref:Phosphatidylglycerol--prolipoprotein diacylglyceryl transferase n=1 Tax=Candidatus Odyssella acanthamoebae TaxID=91604 RepID=A0A077B085_9PROT|nr:prolipoprotein diacylglyceryl transferase [Candidatus Paracaedibacter acanthamoebae]AIK96360.1 diacylglyceryl transferase [Candidatus Paracaedibacter acanthamoebae]